MIKNSICIYHFLVFSWYVLLNYFISKQEGAPQKSHIFQNGGQWKYLTFLNLYLQAIFYGVACLEDVLKRMKGKNDMKFITALRDQLFTTLVFPISTFIFLTFWIFFLYDQELVFPKALDDLIPTWLNHAMHTFILPLSLVEIMQRPHSYSPKKKGLSLLTIACLFYICRHPVFYKLSPVVIAAFFLLNYIFSIGIYLFGEKLNF
ncbi:LOW QUALITY PROTEIN: androgen-dependent TFPI-regulating protein [Suncus etruscus]|uniref:LOW QUALITY PROTEIN: androgen-dependent TFPI-regulating protein n=1 Tax=Suncus etruscus TaxID=109475 RepID=UPI00210F4586|nr:LOW QUALITY PROTEIN: androgen-dependent TFPI-regulating protein [Suncus etruscus]